MKHNDIQMQFVPFISLEHLKKKIDLIWFVFSVILVMTYIMRTLKARRVFPKSLIYIQ